MQFDPLVEMKRHSHFSSSFLSMVFGLCVFVLLCRYSCEELMHELPQNLKLPAVFAFGDSFLDHGNNNVIGTSVKCNFPPYGKDFEGGVATGRFTNGKTPADLIAEKLGITNVIPAYLDPNLTAQDLPKGVSFASGGSGYDPQTSKFIRVISLTEQVELLRDYTIKLKGAVGEERTEYILSNSLHLVAAGTNDLDNTYFAGRLWQLQHNVSSYTDLIVAHASSFVQDLYNLGVRKIAVFSLPPIGCLPAQRTFAGGLLRACSENHNKAAQLLNDKLSRELDSLAQKLPEARVVYLDLYNPCLDLIQHPQTYGFEVSDRGCCGVGTMEVGPFCNRYSGTCSDASNHVFWDSFHPTEKAYNVLLDQIFPKYIPRFL